MRDGIICRLGDIQMNGGKGRGFTTIVEIIVVELDSRLGGLGVVRTCN